LILDKKINKIFLLKKNKIIIKINKKTEIIKNLIIKLTVITRLKKIKYNNIIINRNIKKKKRNKISINKILIIINQCNHKFNIQMKRMMKKKWRKN
jgi:hypothetical protein